MQIQTLRLDEAKAMSAAAEAKARQLGRAVNIGG